MEPIDILKTAVQALDEKKAQELSVIRVEKLTVLADYFVLATATSAPHVRALADITEEKLKLAGVQPHHIEGRATGWILLDYGSVVIHVMSAKNREFYNLEHTWSDGEQMNPKALL